MSKRINVTRREFQDSYRRHYKLYKEMKGSEKSELKGHNIKAMIKELNPKNDYCLRNIPLKRGGSAPPKQFNELWRYGAASDDEEAEEKAEKTLAKIAEWIHTKL